MELKRTPLFSSHVSLGAKMVPFAGWEMPISYDSRTGGMLKEHLAVRQAYGIFDVSHMGEFWVVGQDATEYLNHLCTRSFRTLKEGRAQYCLLLNESGGIIDDIIVYKLSSDRYWIVVNAANIEKDFQHFSKESEKYSVKLTNVSDETSLIAVQGPKAITVVQKLFPGSENLSYYGFYQPEEGYLVSRTGYTGEDGFEVFLPNSKSIDLWQQLIEEGATPVGLGARDSLRLEVGFPLYGNDLLTETKGHETLSAFAIRNEDDFIGKSGIQGSPNLYPVGFIGDSPKPLRAHEALYRGDTKVGEISSGSFSPQLKKGVGLGFIQASQVSKRPEEGENFFLESGGKRRQVTVMAPPFVEAGRAKRRPVN